MARLIRLWSSFSQNRFERDNLYFVASLQRCLFVVVVVFIHKPGMFN